MQSCSCPSRPIFLSHCVVLAPRAPRRRPFTKLPSAIVEQAIDFMGAFVVYRMAACLGYPPFTGCTEPRLDGFFSGMNRGRPARRSRSVLDFVSRGGPLVIRLLRACMCWHRHSWRWLSASGSGQTREAISAILERRDRPCFDYLDIL
jgi:hypothetical protein